MIKLIMSSSSLSTVIKEEERSGFKNNTGVIFDDRFTFNFNYRRNLSLDPRSRFKNNRGVTGADLGGGGGCRGCSPRPR